MANERNLFQICPSFWANADTCMFLATRKRDYWFWCIVSCRWWQIPGSPLQITQLPSLCPLHLCLPAHHLALYWLLGLHFIMGGLYFHLDWFQGVVCKRSAVLRPLVVLVLIKTYLNKQWVYGSLNITFHIRGDKSTVRCNRAFFRVLKTF